MPQSYPEFYCPPEVSHISISWLWRMGKQWDERPWSTVHILPVDCVIGYRELPRHTVLAIRLLVLAGELYDQSKADEAMVH